MDQELDEFFGEVKVKQEGNAHKRRRPEESRNSFGPKDRDKDQGPREKREDSLLVSLARLALKQEEELLVLKQDFSLILFLKAGSNSVLPFLYQAATLYKAKQKESPTWSVSFQPPRTVLALAMIKELATRLDAVTAYKEAQDMGWMDQQGAWEVSDLEWNASTPSGRHGAGSPYHPSDQGTPRGALQVPEGRCRDEVSLHSQAHRNNGFRGDVLLRPLHPRPGTRCMENPHDASGQLRPAADRPGLQESRTSERTHRGESPGLAHTTVRPSLLLQFGNKGNACYMNSLVQVLLWIMDGQPDGCHMGRCAQFLQQLRQYSHKKLKYLSQDMLWCMIISGWKDHHKQHDICEFTSYVCRTQQLTVVKGAWEARTSIDGVGQPRDVGCSTQPLLLPLPNRPPGLTANIQVQSLVDAWHAQEAVHAFMELPSVLIMQISRFKLVRGRVTKLHTMVSVDQDIFVPQFVDATVGARPVRYHRIAVVCHHGHTPKSGHYQAVLYDHDYSWDL